MMNQRLKTYLIVALVAYGMGLFLAMVGAAGMDVCRSTVRPVQPTSSLGSTSTGSSPAGSSSTIYAGAAGASMMSTLSW